MTINIEQINNHIQGKIEEKTSLLENPEYNISEKEQEKLEIEINLLKELHDEILLSLNYNPHNIVFEILANNYNKYDTLIKFWQGDDLFISKDIVVILQGEWLFIAGTEEEFEANKNNYSVYRRGFNMNEVKEIRTIKKEDEDEGYYEE